MAKITKTEFLDNIHDIINEGMNLNYDQEIDNSKKFNIHHYVTSLLEDGQRNPKLMTYLNNYHQFLNSNEDIKEFMVFEQFGQGLSQFAVNNKDVKRVINQMNETLDNYGHELEAYMLIEQIEDYASRDMVRNAYDNYVLNEDEASRDILIDAIDMVSQENDPVGPKLTLVITADAVNRLPKIEYGTPESKFNMIQQKIRDDKARRRMEEIQALVDEYARKVFDEAEAEKLAARQAMTFESIINNNGIELKESIKNIAASDARSNKKLMETLDQYAGALSQGLYEERLYEGFIQNISKYNYLLPVEKEIKRINEAVNQHPTSVAITKILEEMSTTNSYYIIPLIEEDAVRYVKEPSDINRVQLRNALCSFAGDPYCHAMLETIENSDMLGNGSTLDEKAMSIKDQAKMIRENANISAIYSPVQYIKENECVFNANGQFYVKKGNTLATLSEEYLSQLSESFIALCQLVNDPHVIINEDSIVLLGDDKIATINESYVDINGHRETTDTLRNLNEMAMKYEYFDNNFFIMASCLHENFDNIAKINFGKHIALNEDANVNVDMFRLGNNIFINTVNENIDKSTFYHNVNPIQCRNIINKHMGINVASLFEDLMPSQDKILMKLNETKNEYETSIEKYEAAIEKLKKAKEECVSEDNESKLDAAIESAEKKMEDLKSEYKDWQNEVDKSLNADEEDTVKDVEDSEETDTEEKANEPIDADEVENVKDELSQPLSIGTEEPIEGDGEISDDEFNTYLDSTDAPLECGSEVPEDTDEMDSTEVNMVHHALAGDESENEEPDVEAMEDPINDQDVDGVPVEDEDPDEDLFAEVATEEPEEEVPAEETPVEEPAEIDVDEPIDFDDVESDEFDDVVEEVSVPDGYKIADITFDQNLKTGELFKTGNVTVVCPMIAQDGKMFVQSDVYHFYIDEETHLPIVDAANIPVALYNAIVSSIQDAPDFSKADAEGHTSAEIDESPVSNEYMNATDVNAASDEIEQGDEDKFFNFDDEDDELVISTKPEEDDEIEKEKLVNEPKVGSKISSDDSSEKEIDIKDIFGFDDESTEEGNEEDVIIPSYKDGDTEIELPAPDADGSDIPEISADEVDQVKDGEDVINFDDDLDDEEPKAGKDFPEFDEDEDGVEESLEAASEAISAAKEKLALKESKQVENRKKLIKLSAIIKGGHLV